jgi:hypothetical protein
MPERDGRIRLVQLLCPSRHALLALPFDPVEFSDAEAIKHLSDRFEGFKGGRINRRCGVCGSADLRYEVGQTGFATMDEALPKLVELMAANRSTREFLDKLGLTYDSRLTPPS